MTKFFGISKLFSVFNVIRDIRGLRASAVRMLGLDEWKAGNIASMDKYGNKYENRSQSNSTLESWVPAIRLERKLEFAATTTKGNNTIKTELVQSKSLSEVEVNLGRPIRRMVDNFFSGKRALVTGAGQGIGRGIVEALVKLGAKVVALDVNQTLLDALRRDFPTIEVLCADLSDWEATEKAIKRALPIDLLVNNAGIALIDPLTCVKEEHFNRIFDINVKAVVNVTRLIVQDLIKRKAPGSVVTISSQASKAALQNHSLYCATKGAIDAFTRALALEYGPHKIRFNCVNPTVVMTELGRKIWSNPEMGEPMLAKIPLKRFAEIEDVVNGVIFLLSDRASMVTGTCLSIDGGFLAC